MGIRKGLGLRNWTNIDELTDCCVAAAMCAYQRGHSDRVKAALHGSQWEDVSSYLHGKDRKRGGGVAAAQC